MAIWKRRVIKLLQHYLHGGANSHRTFSLLNSCCQNLKCLRRHLHNLPPSGVLPHKLIVAEIFKEFFTFNGTEMPIVVFERAGHLFLFCVRVIQSTPFLKSCLMSFSLLRVALQRFPFRSSGVDKGTSFGAVFT
jgi:hypothetical protein